MPACPVDLLEFARELLVDEPAAHLLRGGQFAVVVVQLLFQHHERRMFSTRRSAS
jgi:hypothetical protein